MGEDALKLEARAFDQQIEERLEAGYIPDLRRARECKYFYNNTWRHPDYVILDFVEQFDLIRNAMHKFAPPASEPVRVLEVGCGPGHMSLEMARHGFDVTGIDLSQKCIETAQMVAADDPWRKDRGPLRYLAGDFLDNRYFGDKSCDVVLFVGALHHFPDQEKVNRQISRILVEKAIVLVHEPTRDRMTRGNAAFIHLVRLLLSQGGGYFQELAVPQSGGQYQAEVNQILSQMRYDEDSGGKSQSFNDNEAGYAAMIGGLQQYFNELHFQERYAFFHELIGGLRFQDAKNIELAGYLRDADKALCRLGVLQPTEFFYVGQKSG